eukprot:16435574-Heterocapsa_arctica.AAC.1
MTVADCVRRGAGRRRPGGSRRSSRASFSRFWKISCVYGRRAWSRRGGTSSGSSTGWRAGGFGPSRFPAGLAGAARLPAGSKAGLRAEGHPRTPPASNPGDGGRPGRAGRRLHLGRRLAGDRQAEAEDACGVRAHAEVEARRDSMRLGDAKARWGERLTFSALGALKKDASDRAFRIINDTSNRVLINYSSRARDKLLYRPALRGHAVHTFAILEREQHGSRSGVDEKWGVTSVEKVPLGHQPAGGSWACRLAE